MRLIITPRGVCAMPCHQGRYNKRMPTKQKQRKKKEMKTKVTQKFLQLDTHTATHTHTKEASFCIPYSSRASFTSCAAYAGDLALGLCGIPYKASTPCPPPPSSPTATHCFRCAEACFITFWLSLLQICAKLLQVVCQVRLTRKLWALSREGAGERGWRCSGPNNQTDCHV